MNILCIGNSFSAFEEPISQEFSEIIRKTVDNMNI